MDIKQIGDRLTFTKQDNQRATGVIEGRDWSFDTLVAYTVRCADGLRYHVNARHLFSGHAF
jgi:hypothetical protein